MPTLKHAIPLRTVFRRCLLVNFAVDAAVIRGQLPGGIVPDEHRGSSFLSVVIAEMEAMRPAGAPQWLGISYNQVVYRIVVRVGGERGVFFWRSDADSLLMCAVGNAMSYFRFHPCRLMIVEKSGVLHVTLRSNTPAADIDAVFDLADAGRAMPDGSLFEDLPTARAFLVELFTAFAPPDRSGKPARVRIRRGRWDLAVVDDLLRRYPLLQDGAVFDRSNTRFDSAFFVRNVPYEWERLGDRAGSAGRGRLPGGAR